MQLKIETIKNGKVFKVIDNSRELRFDKVSSYIWEVSAKLNDIFYPSGKFCTSSKTRKSIYLDYRLFK